MSEFFSDVIHTRIWEEEADPANPFSAARCYCRGYDVYQELLGKASYFDYLLLLLQGERPTRDASAALECLAIALANPGPREPSVHAAMCSGVAGAPASATLMAAVAVGAGSYGGGREVFLAMQNWQKYNCSLAQWQTCLTSLPEYTPPLIWPRIEHQPGFDPHGIDCAQPVLQTLSRIAQLLPAGRLAWLMQQRLLLEAAAGLPLAMTGVAAATFIDLGLTPPAGEMLTLMLRLPGAAAHALEQAQAGFKQFPFFPLDLQNDPGPSMEQA